MPKHKIVDQLRYIRRLSLTPDDYAAFQTELTEREYRLLEDACFTKDRILKERRCIGDKLMIPGSMGQLVPHPMLKELRADESHLAQLLAKIDMPEPEENEKQDSGDGERSAQMRAVVNSRWQKAYG